MYLSNPKLEHTTSGSGRRGARRGGVAWRGRAEQNADVSSVLLALQSIVEN